MSNSRPSSEEILKDTYLGELKEGKEEVREKEGEKEKVGMMDEMEGQRRKRKGGRRKENQTGVKRPVFLYLLI